MQRFSTSDCRIITINHQICNAVRLVTQTLCKRCCFWTRHRKRVLQMNANGVLWGREVMRESGVFATLHNRVYDRHANVSGCKDLFGSLGVTESCEPNIDISSPRWCGEIVIQQSRLYTFSRYEQHCHLFGVVFLGTWQITLLWALVLVSGLLKLFVTENSFHCG